VRTGDEIGSGQSQGARHGHHGSPLAIGRKNHYGSKSLRGTKVAAVMYSLIETCKLLGVSSEQYLTTLAERALVNGEDFVLLPHEFKAELADQA
jgi:hypothetical protein